MIVVWTDTMTPLHSVYYLLAPSCRYIELDLYRNMIMVMMMMTMISGNLDCSFGQLYYRHHRSRREK